MLEPMSSTMLWTFTFRPRTTEEMTMTIMMPMTTPRMVSPERSLFEVIVSHAMRRIWP